MHLAESRIFKDLRELLVECNIMGDWVEKESEYMRYTLNLPVTPIKRTRVNKWRMENAQRPDDVHLINLSKVLMIPFDVLLLLSRDIPVSLNYKTRRIQSEPLYLPDTEKPLEKLVPLPIKVESETVIDNISAKHIARYNAVIFNAGKYGSSQSVLETSGKIHARSKILPELCFSLRGIHGTHLGHFATFPITRATFLECRDADYKNLTPTPSGQTGEFLYLDSIYGADTAIGGYIATRAFKRLRTYSRKIEKPLKILGLSCTKESKFFAEKLQAVPTADANHFFRDGITYSETFVYEKEINFQ